MKYTLHGIQYQQVFSKRGTAIFFAIALLAPFWLSYSVLYVQRLLIKAEVEEMLEKQVGPAELVTLTFVKQGANEQLEWEHSREFRYKGQFYDVVEVIEVGDSITYTCRWDKAETLVAETMEKLVEQENASGRKAKKNADRLLDLVKQPFNLHPFSWEARWKLCKDSPFSNFSTAFESIPLSTVGPPPELS